MASPLSILLFVSSLFRWTARWMVIPFRGGGCRFESCPRHCAEVAQLVEHLKHRLALPLFAGILLDGVDCPLAVIEFDSHTLHLWGAPGMGPLTFSLFTPITCP